MMIFYTYIMDRTMSKPPYVAFYTADFMAGTEQMTNEQVGIYIRLLSVQFQASDGRIKPTYFDEKVGNDADLRAKFKRDENGFFNERMEKERLKAINYSESRRKNVCKRYKEQDVTTEKKEKNSTYVDTHVEDMNLHTNLHTESDSNNNINNNNFIYNNSNINNLEDKFNNNSNKSVKSVELIEQVEHLYKLYPKKKGRGQAIKAIKGALKKIPYEDLKNAVERFAEESKGKVRQYIPYPATWFNGERWQDEPDPEPEKIPIPGNLRNFKRFGRQEITDTDIKEMQEMELD